MKFWLSWWHNVSLGEFELHSPWWISGYSALGDSICAAIIAQDENEAKEIIYKAYDKRPESLAEGYTLLTWRFCESKPNDWEPFGDRFPLQKWMVWSE